VAGVHIRLVADQSRQASDPHPDVVQESSAVQVAHRDGELEGQPDREKALASSPHIEKCCCHLHKMKSGLG
jgi:hypothetical protein